MTAKDERVAPEEPIRIKRYEVISHLATGGMAEVLLAKSSGLGGFEKVFAIKRIRPMMLMNKDFASMILDEARIVATLQHSNIVQVFDVDTDDGAVFIVMEYLHGHDVRAMLRRTKEQGVLMPIEHAVNIVMSVSAGLHHAHEKTDNSGAPLGLVHRDVSPHNVIVTLDGAVKLIDFGIVKALNKLSETAFGIVKGKPGYMSPEQCAGEEVDRRTDVYGVGVMLYQLTTGSMPLDADSPEEYFLAVLERDPIPPSQRVPNYPPDLEEIVMGALHRDPEKRFQTADAVRHALEAFALEQRLPLSPFSLARYVEELFKVETAQWKIAKKAGRSLVEHLTTTGKELAGGTPDATSVDESSARRRVDRPHEDAPEPERPPNRRSRPSSDALATKMVHTPSSAGDARTSEPDLRASHPERFQGNEWDTLPEPTLSDAGLPRRQSRARILALVGALVVGGLAATVVYSQREAPAKDVPTTAAPAPTPENRAAEQAPTATSAATSEPAAMAEASSAPAAGALPTATTPSAVPSPAPSPLAVPPAGWNPTPPPLPAPPPTSAPLDDLDSPLPRSR